MTARLFVLEWWRPAEEIASYLDMLRAETEWAAWFCFSSGMVSGFGLVDEQGYPTEEGYAFQAATGGTMTAIDERAAQLTPEIIGAPLSAEIEMDGGIKVKAFYNGALLEIPGAGVYALSEATVADLFVKRSG